MDYQWFNNPVAFDALCQLIEIAEELANLLDAVDTRQVYFGVWRLRGLDGDLCHCGQFSEAQTWLLVECSCYCHLFVLIR